MRQPKAVQDAIPTKFAGAETIAKVKRLGMTAYEQSQRDNASKTDEQLIAAALGGDQKAQAILDAKLNRQVKVAAATGAARAPQVGGDALDLMAEGALSGNMPSSRSPVLYAKVMQRAAELAKERGLTAQQAVMERHAAQASTKAYDAVTRQYETLKPFAEMAEKNANVLEEKVKSVTNLGGSFFNTPVRELQSKFGGEAVTAYRAALLPVQADFARILNSPNATGVLTNEARDEMRKAIGEGATPRQVKVALDVFRTDARNRKESYEASIADLKQRTVVGGGGPPKVKVWNEKLNKFEEK
jgi:hypothetical protein